MAAKYEDIECVICNENLIDPRPLPCGHSYCGPPRLCLNSIENSAGGLRCAVCRTDHDLKPEEIKPLYGIREYLEGSYGSKKKKLPVIPCTVHKKEECTFWCMQYNVTICVECTEHQHDEHAIRNLKTLVAKKTSLFGKSLLEGTRKYSETLRAIIDSETSQLKKLKSEVAKIEIRFMDAQNQRRIIDEYISLKSNKNEGNCGSESIGFAAEFIKASVDDSNVERIRKCRMQK